MKLEKINLIVGFTGTRARMTDRQLDALGKLLQSMNVMEFHHGVCIGADAQAHEIADLNGCDIVLYPCTLFDQRADVSMTHVVRINPTKEPLERNYDIVVASDILIAAPHTLIEQNRSGTWATIRYARKKYGMPVIILDP